MNRAIHRLVAVAGVLAVLALIPVAAPAASRPARSYVYHLGLEFGLYVTLGISAQAVARDSPIKSTVYSARQIAIAASKANTTAVMVGTDYAKPGVQAFVNSRAAIQQARSGARIAAVAPAHGVVLYRISPAPSRTQRSYPRPAAADPPEPGRGHGPQEREVPGGRGAVHVLVHRPVSGSAGARHR